MVKFIMPDGLSDETMRFMKDVVKELNKQKIISNIDLGALRMLATSYEMYLQATDLLIEEGPVIVNSKLDRITNPAQNVATKNYAQVMKIMTEYGLTVRSRGNIKAIKSGNEKESPLDQFLKKGIKERR